jgi:lysophospholipase L1-like esterase
MKHSIILSSFVLLSFSTWSQNLSIKEPLRYLALGDSYTIGESVSYNSRWPRQLYDSLKSRGYSTDTIHFIAQTGWRTDNLMSAINSQQPDSNYTLVSLLIGVNNQYQGFSLDKYKLEFPQLLHRAIALAGGDSNQVFVVSIPDYAYTPFGGGRQAISTSLDRYDNFARAYCDSLHIKFFYITDISRKGLEEPSLVANDGLHPSGKQYSLYVKRILGMELPLSIEKNTTLQEFQPNLWRRRDTIPLDKDTKKWELYSLDGRLIESGKQKEILVTQASGIYLLKIQFKTDLVSSYRIKIE